MLVASGLTTPRAKKKSMHKYLSKLWNTRRPYIASLSVLAASGAVAVFTGQVRMNPADAGIFVGGFLAFVFMFGPAVWIEIKGIHAANPKPVFVEPRLWVLMSLWLMGSAIIFGLLLVPLGFPAVSNWFEKILDADGFTSGLVMMSAILLVMFGPGAAYNFWIKYRYIRIVEYQTPEWYRRRGEK